MRHLVNLAVCVVLLCPGCKDETESRPSSGSDPAPSSGDSRRGGSRWTSKDKTSAIATTAMKSIGQQPGYLEGGTLYMAMTVGEVQRYWDSLPIPEELRRDGRETAEEIGFDPVSSNWAKHFHVADNAVISATLVRTLDKGIEDVREAASALAAGKGTLPQGSNAAGLAYHSRLHIPTADPKQTFDAMAATVPSSERTRNEAICAPFKVACIGSGARELVMLRQREAAVEIDFLWFATRGTPLDGTAADPWLAAPIRKATVQQALDAKTAPFDHADALGGDAAVWLEADQLSRVAVLQKIGAIADYATAEGISAVEHELSTLRRFEELAAAPRLFSGLALSFDYVDERLFGTAEWPVGGALSERMTARAIAGRVAESKVPTVAALCKDAIACFRTEGFPDLRAVSKRIVAEGFAKDFDEVMRAIDRDDDRTFPLLLAGAWPNLLAAALQAPESMNGAEAGVARAVRDAVLRADGFGGRLSRYTIYGFFQLDADYVGYARAAKQDIDAAKGLLGLSGEELKDVELPGGQRATSLALGAKPSAEAFLVSNDDPFGWAAVASSPERLTAVLGMESQVPLGPVAYLGFPDLWRLIEPWGADSVGFARAWATGRHLEFALELDAGQPRLNAVLGRVPQ